MKFDLSFLADSAEEVRIMGTCRPQFEELPSGVRYICEHRCGWFGTPRETAREALADLQGHIFG